MALKPVYDTRDAVPVALREHYVERDGKHVLQHDGEHPDLAKVNEFRNNNVALTRELTELRPLKAKVEGLDIDAAKAALANAGRFATLEQELNAEKTAHAATRAQMTAATEKASEDRVRNGLRAKALDAGALPKAVEMLIDKGISKFTIDGDSIKAKDGMFSADRPGEPLTVEEWLTGAAKEFSFFFAPSSGSGATGSGRGTGGTGSGDSRGILRNPTAADLGRYGKEISQGKLKVVYE